MKQKNNKIFLSLIMISMSLGLVNPISAAYGFKTFLASDIYEHNTRFTSGYTYSWLEFDIYFDNIQYPEIQYTIDEVINDPSMRYFRLYFDGEMKNSVIKSSSFTSDKIYLGLGVYLKKAMHTIRIEIYNGVYGGNYELSHIKMFGGNYALTEVRSVTGSSFIPPNAREEGSKSENTFTASTCYATPVYGWVYNDLSATAISPPHLIYGDIGLNEYIINAKLVSDHDGSLSCLRYYLRSAKFILKARMVDNSEGDLNALSLINIVSAYSGSVSYNSLSWSFSSKVGGGPISPGASFSLERGDSVVGSTPELNPSNGGSGANGAWKTLGSKYFSISQGQDIALAVDFSLGGTSINMDNLLFHNVQFLVRIEYQVKAYNTNFNYWISNYDNDYFELLLGDGNGQTSTPQLFADTYIVAINGGCTSVSSSC